MFRIELFDTTHTNKYFDLITQKLNSLVNFIELEVHHVDKPNLNGNYYPKDVVINELDSDYIFIDINDSFETSQFNSKITDIVLWLEDETDLTLLTGKVEFLSLTQEACIDIEVLRKLDTSHTQIGKCKIYFGFMTLISWNNKFPQN